MLRNIRTLHSLHRLCTVQHHLKARPIIPQLPSSNPTWCRNYTAASASHDPLPTNDDDTPEKTAKSRHKKKSRSSANSRNFPKGKVLHKRVLSDSEQLEKQKLRVSKNGEEESDLFGLMRKSNARKEQHRSKAEASHSSSRQFMDHRIDSTLEKPVGMNTLEMREARKEKVDEIGWQDAFGTMANPHELSLGSHGARSARPDRDDEDSDDDDHIRLREPGMKGLTGHTVHWYGRQIRQLANQGKIYEALHMFEKTMIEEDRVAPDNYTFSLVVSICGRVGYTKKAFMIFNKMKKFGLEPEMSVYTALFNACANSPFKGDGVRRANDLLRLLIDKGIEPNSIVLRSAVKAYGKLCELQAAFSLVDQMLEAGHPLESEIWCHLLIACISDKEAGLNHAIEVWRRMRKQKPKYKLEHYNLLLRALRDCGVGETQLANRLLGNKSNSALRHQKTVAKSQNSANTSGADKDELLTVQPVWNTSEEKIVKAITPANNTTQMLGKEDSPPPNPALLGATLTSETSGISVFDAQVPNILNPRGRWQTEGLDVVSLGELDTPEKRLTLLGGVPGILQHMSKDKVKPDLRTFSMLLDMVPPTTEAEADVLMAMKVAGVTPDVDLLNQVIRRRCQRKELDAAKEVLPLFADMGYIPNLMTYASLALGCRGYRSGLQLLNDMKTAGFQPTSDIYGILLRRSGTDFQYKLSLCRRMQTEHIVPNAAIVENLEVSIAAARQRIVRHERGEYVGRNFDVEDFSSGFKKFMLFYKPWLINNSIEKEEHPWAQYRRPADGGREGDQEDASQN